MALNIKAAIKSLMGESLISSLFFGSKIIDTGNYERRDLHNVYKDSSAARLVIDKVVDSFVSIPVKWVDKDGKDVEGIYQQELLKSPNYLQTQTQFENAFITQYCIYDECFIDGGIEGVALNKGKRAELNIIQGQYVAFELDSNGKIVSYVNSYNQTKKVPLENIKSTIGNVLDPAVTQHATSKLITASKIIKKIEEGDKMDITAYGNKGANYLVTADGDVLYDKTQAANAQEQINDPSLKGGIRFMGAKAQVHDISKTPADLNILETSKDSRKLLALLYGVPIPLISEEASTRDNVITSEKTLALNTTIPLKQIYCEQLTEFLDDGKGYKMIVDIDKVRQIQKDPKEVQEVLEKAKASIRQRWEAAGLNTEILDGNDQWDQPVTNISDQFGVAPDIDLE